MLDFEDIFPCVLKFLTQYMLTDTTLTSPTLQSIKGKYDGIPIVDQPFLVF